jgi:carboxymethylenebutenolidase
MKKATFFLVLYLVLANLTQASDIKTRLVEYLSGKDTVAAYMAEPATEGRHPALIVIHEWWGLTDWIKEDAREFADSGYVALAVDLYRGALTGDPKEAYKLATSVPHRRAMADLQAAFDYLASLKEVDPKRIGVIGWCMGGSYSFQAAASLPKLAACVINYGMVDTNSLVVGKIRCPVLCNFAELDKTYTPELGEAFTRVMKAEEKEVEFYIYPGVNHAFMNPNNPSVYNEAQALKAWNRIFAFLHKTLR